MPLRWACEPKITPELGALHPRLPAVQLLQALISEETRKSVRIQRQHGLERKIGRGKKVEDWYGKWASAVSESSNLSCFFLAWKTGTGFKIDRDR